MKRHLAEALEQASAGPRLDEPLPPVLTPATWREYKAERFDAYGELGRFHADLERHPARPMHERYPGAPRLADTPLRWGSVHAALETWADCRALGYGVGSIALDAPVVDVSPGLLRDSRVHRLADALVHVDRALVEAHAADELGLEFGTWAGVLVARLVGVREMVVRERLAGAPAAVPVPQRPRTRRGVAIVSERRLEGQRVPVPAAELAELVGIEAVGLGLLVRRGKGALEVELGARELVPLPRRGTPRHHAALVRRHELERA